LIFEILHRKYSLLSSGTSYRLFCLCSQVKDLLVSEEFKPNCAMVVLDFLIRHAIIEPDSGLVSNHLVECDSWLFMMIKTVNLRFLLFQSPIITNSWLDCTDHYKD